MSPLVKTLDPLDPASVALCVQVFTEALDAELRDDRLDSGIGSISVVAFDEAGAAVGYCMGTPSDDGLTPLDLVVVPGNEAAARPMWDEAARLSAEANANPELWARPTFQFHEQLVADLGLGNTRELYQMRAPLPVDAEPVATNAFRPGVDDAAWIEVNNASFATHPEQGSWTQTELDGRMNEPWFNSDGFRLFFDSDVLAGFCWTKVHDRAPLQNLGEIYVIGLAPSHHGLGLGVPMTAAGLTWLAENGLKTAMLYVEAANKPAVATYERLGFSVFATYKAWSDQS